MTQGLFVETREPEKRSFRSSDVETPLGHSLLQDKESYKAVVLDYVNKMPMINESGVRLQPFPIFLPIIVLKDKDGEKVLEQHDILAVFLRGNVFSTKEEAMRYQPSKPFRVKYSNANLEKVITKKLERDFCDRRCLYITDYIRSGDFTEFKVRIPVFYWNDEMKKVKTAKFIYGYAEVEAFKRLEDA